jgi:NhaP-type Na+/H+ or K+/H+ antiporter
MFKGTVLGWIGYQFLIRFEKFLMSRPNPHGVDSVAVKVAGLVVFGFAYATHSGPFLAVFVMGLLFTSTGHVMEGAKDQAHIQNGLKAKDEVDVMAEAEKAGNDKIDGILKPLVFCTLGAIVDIEMLWDYAPVSFALFIAFMLVRFITVVICVSPSVFRSSRQRALALGRGEEVDSVADVTIRDMLFMASVRETGIVPAALLVGAQVAGIGGASTLIALGMGIILCTLVVCPIYKPWLAKKLGLVEEEKTTTTKQSGRYPPGH